MDGALPLLDDSRDIGGALLASNLSVGTDDLLHYKASYSLEPGDLLPKTMDATSTNFAPTRLASQRLGQNVELQLPALAGAPVSLALTSEIRSNWMVADDTRLQRERANLNWSPGPATVSVQWDGGGMASGASAGLACNVLSTIRLPTHESPDHSENLRLSGQDCVVAAGGSPWAGIEARTWGLSYVWDRPQGRSAAQLSVIDPAWTRAVDHPDVEPGYELGLSHRRDFSSLTATALVSLQTASIWQSPGGATDLPDHRISATETRWTADASLTWNLESASVSANWATGMDPLWFTPDPGRRGDRFGLALNLSRWLDDLVAGPSPQFAMNWKWSQLRLPDQESTANRSLSLDIALAF